MKVILAILIFLSTIIPASGQGVALVLSGGGAKGLAHIGVLKALEENEIPVNYIVGTSMGAVVGGFYAAGYSADMIEHLATSEDFLSWVSGDFGDDYNYHYSQNSANASWFDVDIALDSGLNARVKSNIANDLALNFVLAEWLARPSQAAGYNFDSLYIPFRAVAADIFMQQEVVLKSGSLSDAVRASLTVPFFYRPIKVDNRYLFDGGVYNNFPLDIAQDEFKPKFIIGSSVSSKTFDDYPYDQDEKLISQSLLYTLLDNSKTTDVDPDKSVIISPNMSTFASFDFHKAKALIDSGYNEALKYIPRLRSKIVCDKDCDYFARERNSFVMKMAPLKFDSIRFYGFNSSQLTYVRRLFKPREDLYLHDIRKGYYRLVSEDYFYESFPRIVFNEKSGEFDFEVYAKPQKNLNAEFGGVLASRNISELYFGVNFYHFNRYLFKHSLNTYSGRFYQSAQVKTRIDIPAINQFYLEPIFTFNKWDYVNANDFFAREKNPTILKRVDRKAGVNIGMPVGNRFKLELASAYFSNKDRFSNQPTILSSDTLDEVQFNGYRFGIHLTRNSLNRKMYASKGDAFNLSMDYFTGEESYFPGSTSIIGQEIQEYHQWFRGKISWEKFVRFGSYSQGYLVESVISNQPFFNNFTATLINAPAFMPLNDSNTRFLQNFRGHSYVALGMRNIFSLNNNIDFRAEGYLFRALRGIVEKAPQEAGYDELLTEDIYLAASSSLVYHSPVGPVSVGVNYYDDNETRLSVLLHVGYLIFNKRSLD